MRYLLLSTAIVVGAAMVVAAWVNRDLIRIKIASVYARAPAKAGVPASGGQMKILALSGDAPWALSALPECLIQTSESNGSLAYVRAHLPPGAVAIVPPATLVYGDCSIRIDGSEAFVRRGADRLRIPPRVQFYRADGLLALIRETAQRAELRVYQPAH
ncbi:MAG: hypothetical protein WCC84_04565 [Candidatus Cybelea sp.]